MKYVEEILYPTLSRVLADFGEYPPCYRVEYKALEDLRKSLPQVFAMVGHDPYEKFFAGVDDKAFWFATRDMKAGETSETFSFKGDKLTDSQQEPYKGPDLESFTDLTDLMEWIIPLEEKNKKQETSLLSRVLADFGSVLGKDALIKKVRELEFDLNAYLVEHGIKVPRMSGEFDRGEDILVTIKSYNEPMVQDEDGQKFSYPESLGFNIESGSTFKLDLLADGRIIPEGKDLSGPGISQEELFKKVADDVAEWSNRIDRNKNKNAKSGLLSTILAENKGLIDERYLEEPARTGFNETLPVNGPWRGYNQPEPINQEFAPHTTGPAVASMRSLAKATLPEDSELLEFYYMADAEGWAEEQKEELEREWKRMGDDEKKDVPRQLKSEGYPAEYYSDKKGKLIPEEVKSYWISLRLRELKDDADTTETFFEDAKILSNPTLVRFTDQPPEKILKEGFDGYGPNNLGLTFHFRPAPNGTLAFAMAKKDLKTPKDWQDFSSNYGEYVYEFKVPYAVRAYHNADGEDQCVFDVNTVTDLKQVELPQEKKPLPKRMKKNEKIPF